MLSMQPQAYAPTRRPSRQTAVASALALAGVAPLSQAAFFDDSKASFETRNMYFNRDFRDGTSAQQSKRCLLYTSPSPRDGLLSRMPSSA